MADYNLNFSSFINNKYKDKSTDVLNQILYENYKSAPHWQKKYLFNPYPNHTFDFEKKLNATDFNNWLLRNYSRNYDNFKPKSYEFPHLSNKTLKATFGNSQVSVRFSNGQYTLESPYSYDGHSVDQYLKQFEDKNSKSQIALRKALGLSALKSIRDDAIYRAGQMYFGHANTFELNTEDFANMGVGMVKTFAEMGFNFIVPGKKNLIAVIGTEVGDINQCMVNHAQFLRENKYYTWNNITTSFTQCSGQNALNFADHGLIHPLVIFYKSSYSQDPNQLFDLSNKVENTIDTSLLYGLQVTGDYAYFGAKAVLNPVGTTIDVVADHTIHPFIKYAVEPVTDPLLHNAFATLGRGINSLAKMNQSISLPSLHDIPVVPETANESEITAIPIPFTTNSIYRDANNNTYIGDSNLDINNFISNLNSSNSLPLTQQQMTPIPIPVNGPKLKESLSFNIPKDTCPTQHNTCLPVSSEFSTPEIKIDTSATLSNSPHPLSTESSASAINIDSFTDKDFDKLKIPKQKNNVNQIYNEIQYSDGPNNVYNPMEENCVGDGCVLTCDNHTDLSQDSIEYNTGFTKQDVIKCEHYVNLALDLIKIRKGNRDEIAKQVGSIATHEMASSKFIQENMDGPGGIVLDTLSTYLAKGKVRIEDFGAIALQTQTEFGLTGIRDLITAIVKHKSIEPAVKQVLLDVITYLYPEVIIVTMAIQAVKSIKAIGSHFGVGVINNLPVVWKDKPTIHKWNTGHKVSLDCYLLNIHLEIVKKHIKDGKNQLKEKFNDVVRKKVFSILGVFYEDLIEDPIRKEDDKHSRYEKMSQFIKLTQARKKWKNAHTFSEKELKVLEDYSISDEERLSQIEFEIQYQKDSFWNTHKKENVVLFLQNLREEFNIQMNSSVNDIPKSSNRRLNQTSPIQISISTDNEQNKIIKPDTTINRFGKFLREFLFPVENPDFDSSINLKEISKKIMEEEKANAGKEFNKVITDHNRELNNKQMQEMNAWAEEQQTNFKTNKGEYSRMNVIQFMNGLVVLEDISAEFVLGSLASSGYSVVVSGIVYMDYEINVFKKLGIVNYSFIKSMQLRDIYLQRLLTGAITKHAVVTTGLIFDQISDNVLENIVAPNIGLVTGSLVGTTYCLLMGKLADKTNQEKLEIISFNVLQSNLVPFSNWLMNISPLINTHLTNLNSFLVSLIPQTFHAIGLSCIPWLLPFVLIGSSRIVYSIFQTNDYPLILYKTNWQNAIKLTELDQSEMFVKTFTEGFPKKKYKSENDISVNIFTEGFLNIKEERNHEVKSFTEGLSRKRKVEENLDSFVIIDNHPQKRLKQFSVKIKYPI